ncbi:MAG: M23 family metallopeptidase [Saprospiraceae bacterium]|nr:M23 family metallopeptidase [Saprospiraceae bacterium]
MQNSLIKRILHRIKTPYRLVILNHETYKEIGSYQLNLLNVYTLLSMLIVIGALLVTLLLFFTPLKRLIPGYGQTNTKDYITLYKKVETMEKEMGAQSLYISRVQKLINGEVEMPNVDNLKKDVASKPVNSEPIAKSDAEIALEDEQLIEKQISNVASQRLSNVVKPFTIEQLYFISPVQGEISERMNADKNHLGIDIIVPKNTDVKAVMDGTILSADWNSETGNSMTILHSNELISVYRHNSKLFKKTGDYVKAGEVVAIAGNSGELTNGPHLHFELWYRGKAVNPEDYIRF